MNDTIDRLDALRGELTLIRQKLTDEIRSYPTPIAGCDEQFNHLLCERRRVIAALGALAAEAFVPTPRKLEPTAAHA